MKYLLLSILSLFSSLAYCQVSYDYEETSFIHTVELTEDVMRTFHGRRIGFFVLRDQQYICGGSTVVDSLLPELQEILVYGEEGDLPGMQTGEILLIFAEYNNDCSSRMRYFYPGNTENTFSDGGSTTINKIVDEINKVEIDYGSPVCQSKELLFPEVNRPYLTKYRVSDPGIVIDSTNGRVDLEKSTPGVYDIGFYSNYCHEEPSYTLTINEFPLVELNQSVSACLRDTVPVPLNDDDKNLSRVPVSVIPEFLTEDDVFIYLTTYTLNNCAVLDTISIDVFDVKEEDLTVGIENPTCDNIEAGRIYISYLNNEAPGTTYELNGQFFDSSNFVNLKPDLYTVILRNNTCIDTLSPSFELLLEEDCESTQSSGNPVLYLIPHQSDLKEIDFMQHGQIQIIDRNGTVLQSMDGPLKWRGYDRDGRLLENGLYIILFEDGHTQQLHVIN